VTVDAYAHCGLDKYLPIEALEAVMRAGNVDRVVLCQHLGQYDNAYIAELLQRDPSRYAGVALIDHASDTWLKEANSLVAAGFRGLRVTSAALLENARFGPAAASIGLVLLVYAPEGVSSLARRLLGLSRDCPDVPIVISHLGNPAVDGSRLEQGHDVLLLADAPNVHVVLSGMEMFCSFPYTCLDELIEGIVKAFGKERVMWGSNFPVCGEDVGAYTRGLDLVRRERRWGLDSVDAEAIVETTASRVWFQ
jgi:L-fuconolactonase